MLAGVKLPVNKNSFFASEKIYRRLETRSLVAGIFYTVLKIILVNKNEG